MKYVMLFTFGMKLGISRDGSERKTFKPFAKYYKITSEMNFEFSCKQPFAGDL